jgi:hypothetical protein
MEFLSSTHKQNVYYDSHPLAVKPETVDFGPQYETSQGAIGIVYNSFQYVSVQFTLCSLLQNESYARVVLSDRSKPRFLLDFEKSCASHYLFSDCLRGRVG